MCIRNLSISFFFLFVQHITVIRYLFEVVLVTETGACVDSTSVLVKQYYLVVGKLLFKVTELQFSYRTK